MRTIHTVFLLMAFREDLTSCSSSDWSFKKGTEHDIRIKTYTDHTMFCIVPAAEPHLALQSAPVDWQILSCWVLENDPAQRPARDWTAFSWALVICAIDVAASSSSTVTIKVFFLWIGLRARDARHVSCRSATENQSTVQVPDRCVQDPGDFPHQLQSSSQTPQLSPATSPTSSVSSWSGASRACSAPSGIERQNVLYSNDNPCWLYKKHPTDLCLPAPHGY